ncbi:Uncharacterized protein CLAVI_000337 [Candidatus Clavichlamydia salmonicola]|uniref:SufB/SufD family protein n=1 Tax=Candidatus Clavichlamydia salmonicola TaxID=469812 RepID=UPI001890F049|nr:SufD family Fe-S cluster assembly protein [Candidatus Clavichlamydia salmonicola]MBF5050719.1 Uncharacterized protein [Candidatus Clavichlamydia salmonicola]
MSQLLQEKIQTSTDILMKGILIKEGFPQHECLDRFLELTKKIDQKPQDKKTLEMLSKNIGALSWDYNDLTIDESEYRCVFINGRYNEQLSLMPKEAIILPLTAALKTYSGFLGYRIKQWANTETAPLALLNGAAWAEGIFIYIPEHCVIAHPIHICSVNTILDKEKLFICSPRIHVVLGHHAQLKIQMQSQVKSEEAAALWLNSFLDCFLEEEASLECYFSNAQCRRHSSVRSYLKDRSTFKVGILSGEKFKDEHDIRCVLAGTASHAEVVGLLSPKESNAIDLEIFMTHRGEQTTSRQKVKAILTGKAKASFQGRIFVEKEGDKTDAYQRIDGLLLSEGAVMFTQPELEIFADDVKASHGATVGKLESGDLFYMRSRGISAEKARALLIQAFVDEIADDCILPNSGKLCLKDFCRGIFNG